MKTNPLFRCSDVPALIGCDEYRTKEDVLLNVIYRRFQSSIGKNYPDRLTDLDKQIDETPRLSSLIQGDKFNPQEIEHSLCDEPKELVERTITRKAMEIGKNSEKKIILEKSINTNIEKKYWRSKYYTLYGVADGVKEKDSCVEEVTEIKTRMSDYHLSREIPAKFWIQLVCYMHLYDAKKGILIEKFPSGKERRTEMSRKDSNEIWDAINKELSIISQEILSKTQDEIDGICQYLS